MAAAGARLEVVEVCVGAAVTIGVDSVVTTVDVVGITIELKGSVGSTAAVAATGPALIVVDADPAVTTIGATAASLTCNNRRPTFVVVVVVVVAAVVAVELLS